MFSSYIAIGDSFTEGVGDWLPNGEPRGWADRVAEGIAAHNFALDPTVDFRYANLAIRGRKLGPVVEEQVGPAISQRPDLISINAGGNDMLRPNFDLDAAVDLLLGAVDRIRNQGIHVLLLAGPDPSKNLPMGKVFHDRGKAFTDSVHRRMQSGDKLTVVDNFNDPGFVDSTYWSEDGLHLGVAGHRRVAANCLDGLGIPYPRSWGDPRSPNPDPKSYKSAHYFNQYVIPWIGRRVTGRSSGDGREAKLPTLMSFPVVEKWEQ